MAITFDERTIAYIDQQLQTGQLVLLADVHNQSLARLAVQNMIARCQHLKALLLEIPSDSKAGSGFASARVGQEFGVFFNDATETMATRGVSSVNAANNLSNGGYMSLKLNGRFVQVGQGAKPDLVDLVDLAAQAIGKGVRVLACDTNPSSVLTALESDSESSLISDAGVGYRDAQTAKNVYDFVVATGINTGLLMLWGAKHVYGNSDRQGLKERLEGKGFRVASTMSPSAFFTSVV